MAEAIKVQITDDTGVQTISANGGVASNSNGNNKPLNPQAKENNKKSNASVVAKMMAMRSVSYATSNIGKWTGNTRNQDMVNNMKTAVGYGIAFATNPLLGLAVVSMDAITTIADYSYERKWEKIQANQNLLRTGGKGGYRR